jgi:hypothetical protein
VRLDAQLFQHQRHLPDGPVVTYPLAEPEPLSLDAGFGAGFAGPYCAEQVAGHADEAHQFGFQREQCVVFLLGHLPVEQRRLLLVLCLLEPGGGQDAEFGFAHQGVERRGGSLGLLGHGLADH